MNSSHLGQTKKTIEGVTKNATQHDFEVLQFFIRLIVVVGFVGFQ